MTAKKRNGSARVAEMFALASKTMLSYLCGNSRQPSGASKFTASRWRIVERGRVMMRTMIASLGALLLVAAAAPSSSVAQVSTQRMSEITRVLASDEFQGRSPGTPGEEKTIPYLIEQFKAAGLEPAGENGGWTQTVPMIHTQLKVPVSISVSQGGAAIPLNFPYDIYLNTVRPVDRVR